MNQVIQKNLKLFIITLLLLLVGGFFVFTNNTVETQALEDGADAINVLGQTGIGGAVSYYKIGNNNGPNDSGMESPSAVVVDSVNHRLFVADPGGDYRDGRVLVYNLDVDDTLLDNLPDNVLGEASFFSDQEDAGAVSSSELNRPVSLAYDSVGDRLFVSDFDDNRVLVFDTETIVDGEAAINVLGQTDFISLMSGLSASTFTNPRGVVYDSDGERLFVVDGGNNRVLVFDGSANDPNCDSGVNDGICDGEDAVNVLGTTDFVSDFTTTSISGFNGPLGVTYDPTREYLFISDSNNHRVVVYDASADDPNCDSGVNDGICDGEDAINVLGQADFVNGDEGTTQGELYWPYNLSYDDDGAEKRLFVADYYNSRVVVYDVTTIDDGENAANVLGDDDWAGASAPSGTSQTTLYNPQGVAYASDYLYVADYYNNRVMAFDVATIVDGEAADDMVGQLDEFDAPVYTKSGLNDGPSATGLSLDSSGGHSLNGVAIDTTNNRLFVSDIYNNRVLVFNLNASNVLVDYTADAVLGQSDFVTGTAGYTKAGLSAPRGLVYDDANDRLFVAMTGQVSVFDVSSITDGEDAINRLCTLTEDLETPGEYFCMEWGGTTNDFAVAEDLAYDSSRQYLFVTDSSSNRVLVFDVNVIVDEESAINVIGQEDFTSTATATDADGLSTPRGVSYDESTKYLYVSDYSNNRVMIFNMVAIADGEDAVNVLGQSDFVTCDSGRTQAIMSKPVGVHIDSSSGMLFVSESSNYRGGWGGGCDGAPNDRVIIYNANSITDGMNAINILGSPDYVNVDYEIDESDLGSPTGVYYDAGNSYLYVVDEGFNRVMVFSATFGPAAPSACSIDSYTNNSVTMTWTDNSSDEDSFTLEKSTDNAIWTSAGSANSNVTTGTASSLTSGTLYYFRVSATNAVGDSDPASCGSQLLPANEAPQAVNLQSPETAEIDVPLTGQIFTMGTSDLNMDRIYYRFELSTASTFLTTLKAWDQRESSLLWSVPYSDSPYGDVTFTIPNDYSLTTGTQYYWRARAFDLLGEASDYSSVRSFTTVSSSEEEVLDVPYQASFNGESYDASSVVNYAESTGSVSIQAINTFMDPTIALGTGTTYSMDLFDADSDGDLDVIGGQDGGNTSYVYINNGAGSFAQGDAVISTESYGVGDMDNDGDLDIIDTRNIYWNDGAGDFSSSTEYNASYGRGVEMGDLDGDGLVDIFFYSDDGDSKIYINDGDGSFTEDTPSFFTDSFPASYFADSVALADFDGDGKIDIAFFSRDVGPETTPAYLLLNDGGVAFTESILVPVSESSTMVGAYAVDIDDDGDQDLLITNVGLYLNDGAGNFTEASNMPFDSTDSSACDGGLNHADVDGDGDQDVLCASSYELATDYTGQNYIFKNKGDGTFSDGVTFGSTGTNTGRLIPGDLDGDGDMDIIEANGGVAASQTIEQNYIYFDSASFDLVEKDQGGFIATEIFDADNDGDMDMWGVGTSFQRIIKLNDGSGSYSVTDYSEVTATSYETLSVDVNDDGYLDIVEANRNSTNALWLNDGAGAFSSQTNPFGSTSGYYHDAVAADVDGDGDQDVIFSDGESYGNGGEMQLWLNDGTGDFSAVTDPFGGTSNENIFDFDAGDVDNDGDIDAVIPEDDGTILYLNDGAGTFTDSGEVFGVSFGLAQMGDMNDDGWLDIVVHGTQIYLNQGGTFSENAIEIDSSLTMTNGVFRLYDLDGDNDLDVLAGVEADTGGYNVIYRNYGNLSFVKEVGWFNSTDPTRYLTVGDYDGDGDIDIFGRNAGYYGEHRWYENRQSHVTSTDYQIISGTVDSTSSSIYAATLTADMNDYAEYTMSRVPLSYGGTDFDDYENSEGDVVSGGFHVITSLSVESVTFADNDTDATEVLVSTNFSGFDLILATLIENSGEGPFVINKMFLMRDGLSSSLEEVDAALSADPSYVSGGAVLFEEDVFTYDSVTGEYTYNAPDGVSPINTWQSGSPLITKSTVGTVQFDLYNGGGGGVLAFSDVDTDALVITDDINDLYYREVDGDDVFSVAGENGLYSSKYGEEPWRDMTYDVPLAGEVDFNGIAVNSLSDHVLVGDGGYIHFYSADELVIGQICHVAGTPIYSNDMYAVSIQDDYAYVVGDSGRILNIDFTDQNNIVCTDESVDGVTATLNDVKTIDTGVPYIFIVGDSGTYVADLGASSFTDYTSFVGVAEDFNGVSIYGDEALIVGDNGTVLIVGDEVDSLDTGGVEDYYDGILSDNEAQVVGSSGSVYSTDDTVTWSSLYAGTLSTVYSIVSVGVGEMNIAGASGLLKTYSGESIDESDWETVTNGTEYEFAAGGSDLRWRMVMSTDSAYRTPVLGGVSISYSTTATSTGGSPTVNPPSMPVAERPDILSSTSIQWNFADTSDNEVGFKFYDEASALVSEIAEADLEYVVETGLSPNTAYERSISAYNGDGETALVGLGLVHTLANVPGFEGSSVIDNSSVSLSLDVNENSNKTEYAIYEVGTESWLNGSGLLGDIRSFQTEGDWLRGETGIVVSDLTENAMYSFKVMAKNGDDVLTELSVAENIIVHTPVEANLILSKKVGVNTEDEVVGVYFGQPVFAGTEAAQKLKTIPLVANLANVYIAFAGFVMILFLFLVVLNASPCCRKVKHAHKLLFTDLRGRRGDDFYHALHGEDAVRHGRVYENHKHFYRFTNWGVVGVFLGLLSKVGVVLITAFIVYGGFQVQAFENQSGDDVLAGDVLTYQIDYINNGDETATNVVVTDVLPSEVSYVEGSLVNGEECGYASGVVSCSYASLSGDTSDTIEFKALVTGTVGETVINISTGTFTEGDDVVSSNSVTNEIITNEEPVDCGAGETCEVIMGPGWNFFRMVVTSKIAFTHLEESHAVQLTASNTITDNIGLRITSDPIDVEPGSGVIIDVDSDGNGLNDMKVKAQTIESDEISVVGVMLVEEVPIVPDGPVCGDLTCNGEETCSTCAGDCGACVVPPVEVCGNAVCGVGETCSTCAADCGVCAILPVEVCGNAVCGGGESCSSCAADCGACVVPPVDGGDEGDSGDPGSTGGATTDCSDGLDNDGDGLIDLADVGCENEADLDETDVVVDEEEEEAVQEILEAETTNKIVTTISTVVSGVTQEDFEEVKVQVKKSVANVVRSTKKVTAVTINNPTVERVNDIAQEPVVIAATVSSVTSVATVGITGATGASLLTYLQFIFTQPFMLITRRKKRGWGVVYNSITKRPSDLAIVRLYDYETKKLVQTRVTDKMGRYEFIVKPGKYFLEVSKKEYKYPAELLDRAETDGEYQDVYYGDPIVVGEAGVINRPIPLDPDKKMETGKQIKRKLGWKKVQSLFTLLGPILALISFIITPELWIGGLIIVQLVIYFIFKRLADADKPVSWGMVKDALSGKSLTRSIVRVFDTKFNKLLDTQVTEKKGKYAFLVGKNEYYMTTEKDGYQPHKTCAYDMSHEESGYLAEDIGMNKEGVPSGDQDGSDVVAVRSDLHENLDGVDPLKKD